MSTLSIGLAMFAGMLVLMAIRVPIAIAMFVPGAIGYMARYKLGFRFRLAVT